MNEILLVHFCEDKVKMDLVVMSDIRISINNCNKLFNERSLFENLFFKIMLDFQLNASYEALYEIQGMRNVNVVEMKVWVRFEYIVFKRLLFFI